MNYIPFIFLPSLQRKIFLKYIDSVESIKLRDVFNAYMTSYFGAWLNNQNSFAMKKFVTGFTPRLAMVRDSIRSFFEIYPDVSRACLMFRPKDTDFVKWLYKNINQFQPIFISLWRKCFEINGILNIKLKRGVNHELMRICKKPSIGIRIQRILVIEN